ncbi:cell division control protein 50 [Spathaspora passalidarum NRRL Y-27907]|uniref:Cell division control protein 50 n=1 Tax=Spathaspora passalidarum (strain NRRL Y-27907 / 11-Y1) TaxID=619300 RepID=G3AUJ2_SPAPN|nr:cell division control protein 50 [Spathaspora passalidarum NRRL Y-27907]EGW30549.1 cell division control protein 50 [Spathaspora passalidarum NRRL Y-27907]
MNFLRKRSSYNNSDDDISSGDNASPSNIHKSRKPPNTAFRQQRLKAWQPILTPKTVIPLLILIAVIFAPLGIAILYTTYNVEELNIDYSQCNKLKVATSNSNGFDSIPSKFTGYHFRKTNTNPDFKWKLVESKDSDGDTQQTCVIQFNLPRDLKPPLYLYYKLTNFFQNHRKYVDSYDLGQLKGQAVSDGSITDSCKPLKHRVVNGTQKLIYPCGLIANSYFNDTFSSPVLLNAKNGQDNQTYVFGETGISWPSDRDHKFQPTQYNPEDVVPPPNWDKMFPNGYTNDTMPNVQTWEHLQNWMRTAALPSFYKLYGKNTTETMSSGTYEIEIGLNYPVTIFGGTKSVVITTNSIFGGRNVSIGVIYIIVAIVCLVLGIGFLLQYLIKPRKVGGDHNYLQENQRVTL